MRCITYYQLNEFYKDLFALYEKHNISIAHEDGHGAFELERNKKSNREWISGAYINNLVESEDE